MSSIQFWVDGTPVAQGSMRSPKAGVVLHNSPELASWRETVAWAAKDVWRGKPLLDVPCYLEATFYFAAPKKPTSPHYKDTSPDLDKLIRAVGDALEGVVLKNDARISMVSARKEWCWDLQTTPGCFITVGAI